jgi:hypothetical protein
MELDAAPRRVGRVVRAPKGVPNPVVEGEVWGLDAGEVGGTVAGAGVVKGVFGTPVRVAAPGSGTV